MIRKVFSIIYILFFLVSCELEDAGNCSMVYDQRDDYEVNLDQLLNDLETNVIDEQTYNYKKNEILSLIYELEESNPSCFI